MEIRLITYLEHGYGSAYIRRCNLKFGDRKLINVKTANEKYRKDMS